MARYLSFACKQCGRRERIVLGTDRHFAKDFRAFRQAAQSGAYGREVQEQLRRHPDGHFNLFPAVYACRCGWWERKKHRLDFNYPVPDLSALLTDDGEEESEETASLQWKTRTIYRKWRCPKCRSVMRRVEYEDVPRLPCRCCGGELEFQQIVRSISPSTL